MGSDARLRRGEMFKPPIGVVTGAGLVLRRAGALMRPGRTDFGTKFHKWFEGSSRMLHAVDAMVVW